MEIREFAEHVLFGSTVADKLLAPSRLTDDHPGASRPVPLLPARPAALRLDPVSRHRQQFPTQRDLEHERGRGVALHFFANHELLALEAMAAALLRFPDAPTDFRRELTVTLADEQRHFDLYCQRMASCGVELGSQPVNAFFWTTTRDAPSPLDWVVRMSLCFEQANLDFSRFYQRAFTAVGDHETAAVLEQVYREEIAHVRRGLAWFRRWIEPGEDEYDAFCRHLSLPLSPVRARGLEFCEDARRRAGFDESFITKLRTAGGSKGRSPIVHVFTPTSEVCLGVGPDYNPPARFETLRRDLQTVPLFLAARDDIVVVDEAPDVAWLAQLEQAGVTLPEFVVWQRGRAPHDHPRLADVYPWGWSWQTRRQLRPWFGKLPDDPPWYCHDFGAEQSELYSKATSCALLRSFLSTHAAPWLCDEIHVGVVASTATEVATRVAWLAGEGFDEVVIKGVFGVSGRNMRRVVGPTLDDETRDWLDNVLRRQGRVIVEPWLDRVCDLSLRMRITTPGQGSVQGIGRFLTDARGQYKGAVLGPATTEFDEEARRFATGDGHEPKRMHTVFHAVARHLAAGLQRWNYTGFVGVDALLFRERGSLRLKPIVEINARPNMGHVAQSLTRLAYHGRVGLWVLVPKRDVLRHGFADIATWAKALQHRAPLQVINRDGRRQILHGALWTTDPARARDFASVALFGESLAACADLLAPLSPLPFSEGRTMRHGIYTPPG